MKFSKGFLYGFIVAILVVVAGLFIETDYYVYKPGNTDLLANIVEVEDGYKAEGTFHLVTVLGGQATLYDFVKAKFSRFEEVVPLEEAIPKDVSNEEYRKYQLRLMENSQQSSRYVAYKAANKPASIEFNGVYVMRVVEDMPADGVIEVGDRIVKVDGERITTGNDLVNYLQTKSAGTEIQLEIIRNEETIEKVIEVVAFKDEPDKVGIGIQLVNDQKVVVEPDVQFNSGKIGGPSAGLMFTLEMYNQLTEEDITKGYDIVGTGEMDYDGSVLAIGGVDKKVVAAHTSGMDIFFVPNEKGKEGSNYEVALETAKKLKTKMKIVPVDTFDEALDYLKNIEPKQ